MDLLYALETNLVNTRVANGSWCARTEIRFQFDDQEYANTLPERRLRFFKELGLSATYLFDPKGKFYRLTVTCPGPQTEKSDPDSE
jgi:hypothetical protein